MTPQVSPDEAFPYGWLDHRAHGPGPHLITATCLTYLAGVDLAGVVKRLQMSDVETVDLSGRDDPWLEVEDSTAVFELHDWVVIYQDNGFPEQIVNRICESADVVRAIVVFWNVNAAIEFSYWERGTRVAGFRESVDLRTGTDPSRLDADIMRVGLGNELNDADGPVAHLYRRMLALADRLTGLHLPEDFLERPGLVVGHVDA